MVNGWVERPITEVLKPNGIKIGPFGSQLKKEMLLSDGVYRVYGQQTSHFAQSYAKKGIWPNFMMRRFPGRLCGRCVSAMNSPRCSAPRGGMSKLWWPGRC